MPGKRTSSFILELPLRVSPADERACTIMLDAARNIGNAVLGEGLRRLDLTRESKAYQAARKMLRGERKSLARKARATEFKRLFGAAGVTGHGLRKFVQECRAVPVFTKLYLTDRSQKFGSLTFDGGATA
jgi:putative transposase